MSKPITSDLSSKYADFNVIFDDLMKTPLGTLKPYREDLWNAFQRKRQAVEQANFPSSPLSDKITSKKQLLQDIDDKMGRVRARLFGSGTPSYQVLEGCVGYDRQGNNCWGNAFLQVCQQRPHLWHAVSRVGTFCKGGGNIDSYYMECVLQEFQEGTPDDLTVALAAYNKINHLIYKLNVVCQLKNKKVAPAILSRFRFPIDAYRERIREKMQEMLAVSGTGTKQQCVAWGQLAIEQIVQEDLTPTIEQRKMDGEFLLKALTAYEEGCKARAPVPSSVSQNMRAALYRLFTYYHLDGRVSLQLSLSANNNEDCHEAVKKLMDLDEWIRQFQGDHEIPQGHFLVQITSVFTPLPEAPIDVPPGDFSTLQHNSFLTRSDPESEIRLNLPASDELSLEELLRRQACQSESNEVRFICNGMLQNYRAKESRTRIQGIPDQLSFQLVRFRSGLQKNKTPVLINRYMLLPEEAITPPQVALYQLECFIVHTGTSISTGHYISYRKVNGKWIEFDDAQLSYKTDDEIDDILHQRTHHSHTPYLLYYSRVPENEHEAMLKIAKSLSQKVSGRAGADPTALRDQSDLVAQLDTLADSLKSQDKTKTQHLYESFIKAYPECAQHMHRLLELVLGLTPQVCAEDPTHLKATIGGDSIPKYVLKYEVLKLKRLDAELSLQDYKRFYLHLYSKEEGFEKIFNDLPQPLRDQIQHFIAPDEGEAFEMAPKYGNLREFILQRLDSTKDLSAIERTLEKRIDQCDSQMHRLHLEDYLVLLRNRKLNKKQLYNLLVSFKLPDLTFEQLLHGINIHHTGKPMKGKDEQDRNQRSLKSNPRLLLELHCKKGTEKDTTPSILEAVIIALQGRE